MNSIRRSGRWHRAPLALWLFALSAASAGSNNLAPALDLAVGHSQLIDTPGVERVAIGDGDLAQVEVIENTDQVLLIGLASGQTDLRIWSDANPPDHRRLRVRPRPGSSNQAGIEHLASRIDGVELERIDGDFLLTGRPTTERDAQRLAQLINAHPEVGNFTDTPDLAPTPTVQLHARFVELRQSALQEIGLKWNTRSPGISFTYASDLLTNDAFRSDAGDFLASDSLPLDIGQANRHLGVGLQLSAMIDLLDESGEARVIAEPMLSTLSGSSAEFQAGGEVPIPVRGEQGNTNVTFKDYGILLKVAPEVADSGLIRTQIEVEVSDIDESVSVLGVPGFSVRNARTQMNGPSGQTLLIAGLIDEKQSEAVSQLPGLGNLPVIGRLFQSRRFQNDETELVVLITPRVTSSPNAIESPSDPTIDSQRASREAIPEPARAEHSSSALLPLNEGF